MTDPRPIRTRGPIDITVRPPGSKSQTNRALVCAVFADGTSTLGHPLTSDDSGAMVRCLGALGGDITTASQEWTVRGVAGQLPPGAPVVLDVGASGTTARFVTAVAAVAPRRTTVDGTARMRERPIAPLVESLRSAGARLSASNGFLPISVDGGPLAGGSVTMDASTSSQFLSALLMVAPLASSPVEINVQGLASPGYVTTTREVMGLFGVAVAEAPPGYRVVPQMYRAAHVEIEADASAAVYPWAAAAITGGQASIEGIPARSTQPDLAILGVLSAMGCHVEAHTVRGPARLSPINADLSHMPDGAIAVAVLCAVADGTSHLRGLATLRVKETDRIAAIAEELHRLGVNAEAGGDSVTIEGSPQLRSATIETYDDHRMAMAFSLAGLVAPGVAIADPGCVTKTWPEYFDALADW